MRRAETLKEGNEVLGNRVRVKVAKNKVAPPFREAEFDLIFGEGISKEGNILDVAVDRGIIQKSGSWFSHNDERLGQGRNSVKEHLKANPDFAAEIEAKIREDLGMPSQSAAASIPGESEPT
ncbi:MAG: DNA recombination/repair protein RecA, partial [Candidatus Poribacteria bacterium]|nr:DNA recombination/repair protein RecA [Candidatus Poribacteria bacterium]